MARLRLCGVWFTFDCEECKGPGKRGHIVTDTLLPTQMLPRFPARTTFVFARNVSRLRSPRNITDNNVSATMCPRLPGP